ncbi:MAG: tetratricopeptide repeat protein [Firmicutes bacterium]|nr:tetratricopeptide repeat protein [Bacillota bacterium]
MPIPLLLPALVCLVQPPDLPLIAIHPTQKALDLLKVGKIQEAMNQLDLAIQKDGKDPAPHWIKAQVYSQIAEQTKGWESAWYTFCAEESACTLLDLPNLENDTVAKAMSLLQHAHDAELPKRPAIPKTAQEAFDAGETAFHASQWEVARGHYQRALELHPTYSAAALYVGDTYYSEKRMAEAITWFKKTTTLNPHEPRGWRYMADALTESGQPQAAEAALMDAIKIFPGNRASWQPLMWKRRRAGRPMTRLAFWPKAHVTWDAKGNQIVSIEEHPEDSNAQSAWLLLASSTLDAIDVKEMAPGSKQDPALITRFQQERFFWELALTGYGEQCAKAGSQPKDRILKQFLAFQKDGQLDAALFLLRYREAFRPDYEAWLKSNPNGVQAFIDRYNLCP